MNIRISKQQYKSVIMEQPKVNLQELYQEYIQKRLEEYQNKNLTGRLVIDIQKGVINSIQNQEVIAGSSTLNYNLENLDKLNTDNLTNT